jgi:hypothetical protein
MTSPCNPILHDAAGVGINHRGLLDENQVAAAAQNQSASAGQQRRRSLTA